MYRRRSASELPPRRQAFEGVDEMNMNCEYVREVYPDVLNKKAEATIATAVRAHIARCAECREEAALMEQLHAAVVQVPAGLHERISVELTRPAARTFRLRNIAYAATVAVAIIGGSLLLRPKQQTPLPDRSEERRVGKECRSRWE